MNTNVSALMKEKYLALDIQMSWWAMAGLGEIGKEWSEEQKVRVIAEAGFDGINGFLPSPDNVLDWRKWLDRYGLTFSINAYPKSAQDMKTFLEEAARMGGIAYVNAQVMTPLLIDEPAEHLLIQINELSAKYGIPVFIETHRGTITQDLIRTALYAKHLSRLPLTIDFSHYVVAGEMHTANEEAEVLLNGILERTSSIHARISNGEQVQVSIGENGEHPMLPRFMQWWGKGMSEWIAKAEPKKTKLPVVCELGPAPYAITIDEHAGRTKEISDRWQQSLLLKEILKGLWQELQLEPSGIRQ